MPSWSFQGFFYKIWVLGNGWLQNWYKDNSEVGSNNTDCWLSSNFGWKNTEDGLKIWDAVEFKSWASGNKSKFHEKKENFKSVTLKATQINALWQRN